MPLRIAAFFGGFTLVWLIGSDALLSLLSDSNARSWAWRLKDLIYAVLAIGLIYRKCQQECPAVDQDRDVERQAVAESSIATSHDPVHDDPDQKLIRLRSVFDSLTEGVVVADTNGRILDWNEAALKIHGIEDPQQIQADASSFFEHCEFAELSGRMLAPDEWPIPQLANGNLVVNRVLTLTRMDTGIKRVICYSGSRTQNRDDAAQRIVVTIRDLTEKTSSQRQLASSERRFRELADSIPQLVWITDAAGGITELNQRALDYTGVSLEDLKGWNWRNVVHPDDCEATVQLWLEVLKTGEPRETSFRIRSGNGEYRWHLIRQVPACDANGVITGWYGTCTDIEDLKRAKSALNQMSLKLRTIIENIPQGVFWKDLDSKFLDCNQVVAKAIGCTSTELISSIRIESDTELTDEQADLLLRKNRDVLESGVPQYHVVESMTFADGKTAWLDMNRIPIRDESGSIIGVLGTWEDITDRRLAEAKLRASEQTLRQFIEHTPAPIAMFDREMRYLHASRRWYQGFRVHAANIIGKSHYDIFPEIPQEWKNIHQRCLAGATERSDGELFNRSSGAPIWIRWEVIPWHNAEGSIGGIIIFSENITEQKLALIEQRKLVRLIEQSSDFIKMANLDGQITFLNASGRRMLGLRDQDPVTQLNMIDYVPEQSRGFFQETIVKSMTETGHWEGEMQLQRLNSSELITVHRTSFLVKDPETGEAWFATVMRDITEQKRAEAELWAAHDRMEKTIQAAPIAICSFAFHPDGKPVMPFASPRIEDLYGLTPDVLADDFSGAMDQIFDEDRPIVIRTIEESANTMTPWHCEFRIHHREKGTVWIEGQSIPSRQPDGSLIWHGYVADITARKTIEQAMRDRDRTLTMVTSAAKIGLLVVDADYRYRYVNRAYAEMRNLSVDEIIGNHVKQIVGDQWHQVKSNLDRALAGESFETEFFLPSNDYAPDRQVLRCILRPLSKDDDPCALIVIQDVTEQKRTQRQFQQAQKMEAVGRLAAGVAHDFNNLLTVINGYSVLLLNQLPSESFQRHSVAAILDAGERAARLTQQLLLFNRRAIVQSSILNLNDVINQALKLLRRLIEEDIVLDVEADPSLPPIKAAAGQIDQVLMNLVVNARDAMPQGGRLLIKTTALHLMEDDPLKYPGVTPGHYAELAVSDTGIGMTEEVKSKIFEPFFTTKDVGKGSGLGLCVVHGAVSQSGGTIVVESTVGCGSTFRMVFPGVTEQPTESKTPPDRQSIKGNETILLVEDDSAVRRIVKITLEPLGYHVIEAVGGAQAIERYNQADVKVDLLLTDVVMPGMGGRDLAQELRRHRPDLPVIYLSGYTDDAVIQRGISEESDVLIQKPFTAQVLARKIRQVLDACQ